MKRSLVYKRDFIYSCSALRFDSSLRLHDFLVMMKDCIKPKGTRKGLTPTSGFFSLRKCYLQIWWWGKRDVRSWLEDQWKISEKFQDVFKNTIYLYSEKQSFNAKSLRQNCTVFHVTANYAALPFKKSSVKHPPQYAGYMSPLLLNLRGWFALSFGKAYSASEFITRSFSFLCLILSLYLLISNRFCPFVMGDGN